MSAGTGLEPGVVLLERREFFGRLITASSRCLHVCQVRLAALARQRGFLAAESRRCSTCRLARLSASLAALLRCLTRISVLQMIPIGGGLRCRSRGDFVTINSARLLLSLRLPLASSLHGALALGQRTRLEILIKPSLSRALPRSLSGKLLLLLVVTALISSLTLHRHGLATLLTLKAPVGRDKVSSGPIVRITPQKMHSNRFLIAKLLPLTVVELNAAHGKCLVELRLETVVSNHNLDVFGGSFLRIESRSRRCHHGVPLRRRSLVFFLIHQPH